MRRIVCGIAAGMIVAVCGSLVAAERPDANAILAQGKLAEGEKAFIGYLEQQPKDDNARFGLGVVQFLRSIEHLAQGLYRHGAGLQSPLARSIPIVRLPVPENTKPEELSYEKSRKILENLVADLGRAEATLAKIGEGDVSLPLVLAPTRFDFDGDGTPDDSIETILGRFLGGPGAVAGAGQFVIGFDRGDVAWLRGYCHLLSALCEIVLAHDARDLFERTAHQFFPSVESPFEELAERRPTELNRVYFDTVADAIAFVHLLRLPVAEPKRLEASLGHFEAMLSLSRESWKLIDAETDDNNEWLPNPRQTGAMGVPVRREQIDGWLAFVEEAEAIFAGKRLVPFWRGSGSKGVNLRRVFTEPRPFDLVLWIQGSAAIPYLEEGELTDSGVWERLLRVFGGDFVGFAIWFN